MSSQKHFVESMVPYKCTHLWFLGNTRMRTMQEGRDTGEGRDNKYHGTEPCIGKR